MKEFCLIPKKVAEKYKFSPLSIMKNKAFVNPTLIL